MVALRVHQMNTSQITTLSVDLVRFSSGERLHNSVTAQHPLVSETRGLASHDVQFERHIAAGLVQYYDPLSILSVIPSRAGASGGTPMNFATAALLCRILYG